MRIELCREFREAGAFAAALQGELAGAPETRIGGISTDSAQVERGDVFLALPGANHNGWEFLGEAARRGAAGVILPRAAGAQSFSGVTISVEDAVSSLLAAAAVHRSHLPGRVIAVSGSAGKTTSKEAIATVLGEGGTVCRSRGNFNSTLGMPLSLLSMDAADYYVLELGINHPGEMERMSLASAPDLAVLTNIGSAHIGNFGSYAALCEEKRKIRAGMRKGGILLLPQGCAAPLTAEKSEIFHFGVGMNCDFYAENIRMDANGVTLTFCGKSQKIPGLFWGTPGGMGVSVLLIVGAVAELCGISAENLVRGVARAAAFAPRMRRHSAGERLLIDDAYNASPETMASALETLDCIAGGRQEAAVLGDMEELGEFSAVLHETVGKCVRKSGVSVLFTYGEKALDIAKGAVLAGFDRTCVYSFLPGEEKELAGAIEKKTGRHAVILFKASRKARLEEIVRAVERRAL